MVFLDNAARIAVSSVKTFSIKTGLDFENALGLMTSESY
jgi:hypothetical protein